MSAQDDRSPFRKQRWLFASHDINDASGNPPPLSLMQANGASHSATSGESILSIQRAEDGFRLGQILSTHLQTMKASGAHGTFDFPAYVQYEVSDGDPVAGETWGPKANSRKLHRGYPGFVILGDAHDAGSGTYVVWVNRDFDVGAIRFEISADLNLSGGPVDALLLDETWASTGTTIQVRDPFDTPGCWQGYTGYKGWAIRGEDGVYDVLWMERKALVIYFTLTQDTNTSSGTTATFTSYFQQGNKTPGSSGLVYDHQELYPKAKNGAKGIAVWNDDRKRYEVVVCQQMGNHFKAKANATFCKDANPTVKTGTWAGIQHSPFNQVPAVPSINNYWQLAGRADDDMFVVYDAVANDYKLVQVTPHEFTNYSEYRVDCETTDSGEDAVIVATLQGRGTKFLAYTCDEVSDWDDLGEIGENVKNVTLVSWDGTTLTGTKVAQVVLCLADPYTFEIDTTEPCPEESS